MAKIEEDIIKNSTPEDLKEKKLAKLGTIVTNQAMIFAERIIPILEQKIKAEATRQAVALAQQQLSELKDKCPPEVEKLINIRNNIVGQANSIVETINKVSTTVAIASTGINTLISLIKALKIAKISLSVGSKFAPVVPGAVASGISDLDDLVTNKTFDIEGNSKITPVVDAINGIAVPIALISFYISKFLSLILTLDALVKDCSTTNNPSFVLSPISEDLITIAKNQDQAEKSPNSSLYQGFILEIEEVPFSPTVNRRRALGKNSDGITLIQTELSFTPSNKVMIDELKFIIDRDNLKAY